jgi:hypothetical protein
MKFLNKSVIILLLVSISLTFLSIRISYNLSRKYFKSHSFFYDPVMSFSSNIPFYKRMQKEEKLNIIASRLNFAKLHFKSNYKSPAFFIPAILLAPRLLLTPWYGMLSTSIMLLIFLYVLGYSVYLRYKKIDFSIAIICLFSAAPVLIDPRWGLSSGQFDLPAGFLFASGIISFLNWHQFRRPEWLICFSFFVSMAILGRAIISAYLAFVMVPPIIYSIFLYYKQDRDIIKCIIKPLISAVIIIGIFCGYFLYIHFNSIFFYYSKLLFSKTDSVIKAAGCFFYTSRITGSLYLLLVCIFIIFIFLFQYLKKQSLKIPEFLMYLWIVSILPVYWIFFLKSTEVYYVYLIELPILFILFLPQGISAFASIKRGVSGIFSAAIILLSGCFILSSFYSFSYHSDNPGIYEKDSKKVDRTIASFIKDLKPGQTWTAFFDEDYSRIPNCECFYRYGVYPEKYSDIIFYLHNNYWNSYFPGMSPQQIADSICRKTDNLSLIITFNNISDINKFKPGENFDFAKEIAGRVTSYVQESPGWEKRFVYKTINYSELAFYFRKD